MANRRKNIGIIGPNESRCNIDIYNFGLELGRKLVENNYTIICGGMQGIMDAVCKGARTASNYTYGATVGILPASSTEGASEYADILIPTGMGWARNQMIINASDIVVSIAGGAGTLSEIAYAWQAGKTVVCCTGFDGWSKELAGKNLDTKNRGLLKSAENIEQILNHIKYDGDYRL